MSLSHKATHVTPPAVITHTVITLRGPQTGDISISHARTTDARIGMVFGGMLIAVYSADAAQGLLEAFTAARGHIAQLPQLIPAPPARADEPAARTTLAIEWTRRPDYAAEHRTGLNQLGTAQLHWVDLYTGAVTFRFRDRTALHSTIDLFTDLHRSATVVFLDGDQHGADPTSHDYTAA